MLSYNNDPSLKNLLFREIEKHRLNDQIIKGTYGKKTGKIWRGCAIGCSIHSLNKVLNKNYSTKEFSTFERENLWPEWLFRLEDQIFEYLPTEKAVLWPGKFAKAIPVGVNLTIVQHKYAIILLKQNLRQIKLLTLPGNLKSQVISAVKMAIKLHNNAISEGNWDKATANKTAKIMKYLISSIVCFTNENGTDSILYNHYCAAHNSVLSSYRTICYTFNNKRLGFSTQYTVLSTQYINQIASLTNRPKSDMTCRMNEYEFLAEKLLRILARSKRYPL